LGDYNKRRNLKRKEKDSVESVSLKEIENLNQECSAELLCEVKV
jgi:hypothetical protein